MGTNKITTADYTKFYPVKSSFAGLPLSAFNSRGDIKLSSRPEQSEAERSQPMFDKLPLGSARGDIKLSSRPEASTKHISIYVIGDRETKSHMGREITSGLRPS